MRVLRDNKVIREYRPRIHGRWAPSDLTDKILAAYIAAEQQGLPVPTIRQLQDQLHVSSTSVVNYHIHLLATRGDVTIGAKGTNRTVRVTTKGRGYPGDTELLRQCLEELREHIVRGPLIDTLEMRLNS